MKTTIAKYGDRWDLLAYDLYGDAAMVTELMKENGHCVDVGKAQIREGSVINIPKIATAEVRTVKVKAPWK